MNMVKAAAKLMRACGRKKGIAARKMAMGRYAGMPPKVTMWKIICVEEGQKAVSLCS